MVLGARWNRAHDLFHLWEKRSVQAFTALREGDVAFCEEFLEAGGFSGLSDRLMEIEAGVDPETLATDLATLRARIAELEAEVASGKCGLKTLFDLKERIQQQSDQNAAAFLDAVKERDAARAEVAKWREIAERLCWAAEEGLKCYNTGAEEYFARKDAVGVVIAAYDATAGEAK